MALPPKLYTWLCGCFAAFGSILYGYDLGVIAGVLEAKDFLETTGHPSSDYIGFITSSMLLGAFVATIPAGEPARADTGAHRVDRELTLRAHSSSQR